MNAKIKNADLLLPEEIVWDGEHASALAHEAIADLQMDIVPPDVVAHVEGCLHCSRAVGEAGLRSRAMGQVWAVAPADAIRLENEKATYPLPWRALFAALFMGGAGAVPAFLALPHFIGEVSKAATQSVPVVAQVTVAAAGLHAPAVLAVSGGAAVVLTGSVLGLVKLLRSSSSRDSRSS